MKRTIQNQLGGLEQLEARTLLTSDFGDAPDVGAGTGVGDYQTLLANGGPSHVIDSTQASLFLGARVDGETNATPNLDADGDDKTSQPDDEDGLVDSIQDMVLTVGTAPVVQVRATNTTGTVATLFGWIDYNRDGVFDNATERASATVPNGTNKGTIPLAFPAIPANTSSGMTYARFRLSSDAAAGNATGAAVGGEVEDYVASITQRTNGTADSTKTRKIASGTNGGPTLVTNDFFGISVASLGDLDGDGVNDLAVGAYGDDTQGTRRGAVYIEFMNANGTVKSGVKLASSTGGGPALSNYDYFGSAVASLGDLDGDGINDLAVGASGDDTGGSTRGAVHILMLNANGTIKNSVKIASGTNGGPALGDADSFGSSVATLGDMDGDGVTELAVGATGDNTNGFDRGAVYILRLNSTGTVKNSVKIADHTNGGPTLANSDQLGNSLAALGDLDGDGIADLAVGAKLDDTGGTARGAVYVMMLTAAGSVKSSTKLAHGSNGTPGLVNNDQFGFSLAALGDMDGDGVTDLGVGATNDDTGGDLGNYSNRGALHLLLMNANGTVKSSTKLGSGTNGGPTLANNDHFGSSVALLGDLNGDGLPDLAVGTYGDRTGGSFSGAVHVLFLKSSDTSAPVLSSFTRQNPISSRTDADVLVFRATFNEAVVNVDPADFAVTGTTATVTNVALVGGSNGTQYDITVSGGNLPNLNGTVGLNFSAAPTISDLVGNALPGVEPVIDETYLLDNAIPNLVISPNAISTSAGQVTFTFQFSEAVTDFNATDISVVNGIKGTFTAVDADTYTLVVSPILDGDVTVTVAAGAAKDASGLGNLLTTATVTFDRTAPSLVITPNGTITNSSSITFTFQFSKAVSNFIANDITVVNGTKGTFTVIDADTYTLVVTPVTNGAVTVTVNANSAQDALGNGNSFATASVTSDRTSLDLTVVADSVITNANTITFTFQFSKSVTGFDVTDIVLTNGTKGAFTAIDGDTYTLIVIPISDGIVTATVAANAAHDSANNTNVLASGSTISDRTAPTLTISPNGTTTSSSAILFTFQFNETVVGFDSSDITVANGSKGTFTAIDGDTYTLIVIPIQQGAVVASVASNAARDGAGNANSFASATVTWDQTRPSVVITPNNTVTNSSQILFTFQLSEGVSTFSSSLVAVTNGVKGTFTAIDARTYTLLVFAVQDGPVTVTVPANAIQDSGGNTNVQASSSVVVDRIAPVVSVLTENEITNADEIVFTFQFSESVFNFDVTDVFVTNGLKGTFTVIDSDTYTLVVLLIQEGTVSVSVAADSVRDIANNSNVLTSDSIICDRTKPTLVITPDQTTSTESQITFTFQFSEFVSLFESSDIIVANGVKGSFTSIDQDTYTLVVFPIQSGTISIDVASVAIDLATNSNRPASASIISQLTSLSLNITPDGTLTSDVATLFTFQFSASVSGFDITDINVTNGVPGTFSMIDGDTYTLEVFPISDGQVSVHVSAGAVVNSSSLGNTEANATVTSDRTPPQIVTSASFVLSENTLDVATVVATDAHGPVIYTLQSGLDSLLFSIDVHSGLLQFLSAPDFEVPGDFDSDNIYLLQIRVVDALGLVTIQDCSVTVTALDDNRPVFASETIFAVDENTSRISNLFAFDADLPSRGVQFAISGGDDATKFSVSSDGVLAFISPPNFELPGDLGADNHYHVIITAFQEGDAALSATQEFVIEVLDVDEPPTDITLSTTTVNEQLPAGTVVGTLSTVDPDAGSLFGYTLVAGIGSSDNSRFRIVGNALQTNAVLNFATQASYSVRIRSADSQGLSTEKVFTIRLNQVVTRLLDLATTSVIWTKNTPSVKVLPQIVVTNGVNFANGALNVSIVTVGTKKLPLDLVQIPSIRFGTFVQSSRTATLTNVTIHLGSNDSSSMIQEFLRGIAFSTKGKGLNSSTRTLRVTLSDADGHATVVSQQISIRKSFR